MKSLQNFPPIPDFRLHPKCGLQYHVFEGINNPTALDAYRIFFTDDFVKRIKQETNEDGRYVNYAVFFPPVPPVTTYVIEVLKKKERKKWSKLSGQPLFTF